MPVAHGHSSGMTCPAVRLPEGMLRMAFACAAAPVVAASLSVSAPAEPIALTTIRTRVPGDALSTAGAVMFKTVALPPGCGPSPINLYPQTLKVAALLAGGARPHHHGK